MLNILDDAEPASLLTEEWNERAREEGIGVKRRATLMDIRKALKDKKMVHCLLDRWHNHPSSVTVRDPFKGPRSVTIRDTDNVSVT
jgi:hypothetical protein